MEQKQGRRRTLKQPQKTKMRVTLEPAQWCRGSCMCRGRHKAREAGWPLARCLSDTLTKRDNTGLSGGKGKGNMVNKQSWKCFHQFVSLHAYKLETSSYVLGTFLWQLVGTQAWGGVERSPGRLSWAGICACSYVHAWEVRILFWGNHYLKDWTKTWNYLAIIIA